MKWVKFTKPWMKSTIVPLNRTLDNIFVLCCNMMYLRLRCALFENKTEWFYGNCGDGCNVSLSLSSLKNTLVHRCSKPAGAKIIFTGGYSCNTLVV